MFTTRRERVFMFTTICERVSNVYNKILFNVYHKVKGFLIIWKKRHRELTFTSRYPSQVLKWCLKICLYIASCVCKSSNVFSMILDMVRLISDGTS